MIRRFKARGKWVSFTVRAKRAGKARCNPKSAPRGHAAHPKVGMRTTVNGAAAKIVRVHPAGTIDVERLSDGQWFRVTGLPMRNPAKRRTSVWPKGKVPPHLRKFLFR